MRMIREPYVKVLDRRARERPGKMPQQPHSPDRRNCRVGCVRFGGQLNDYERTHHPPASYHPIHPYPSIRHQQSHPQGLGEHWGWIDEYINADLENIGASYSTGPFVLGFLDEILVATGALIPETETSMRVVRMSFDRAFRRQRLATGILGHLIQLAQGSGVRVLVLETNEPWHEVVEFYLEYGFQIAAQDGGNVHMGLDLMPGWDYGMRKF